MAVPIVYNWPETIEICERQDIPVSGGFFIGNFPSSYNAYGGFARSVLLYSPDNNSGATFTVNGINNSLEPVSVQLTGLNNNFVDSQVEEGVTFTRVDSIYSNVDVSNVSVGWGIAGYGIIKLDSNRANFKVGVNVVADIPFSIYGSMVKIDNVDPSTGIYTFNDPYDESFLLESAGVETGESITIPSITGFPTVSGTAFFKYDTPSTCLLFRLGSLADPASLDPGSFTAYIVQQGLTS